MKTFSLVVLTLVTLGIQRIHAEEEECKEPRLPFDSMDVNNDRCRSAEELWRKACNAKRDAAIGGRRVELQKFSLKKDSFVDVGETYSGREMQLNSEAELTILRKYYEHKSHKKIDLKLCPKEGFKVDTVSGSVLNEKEVAL